MAISKLVKKAAEISGMVTAAYRKVEDTVTGGYVRIEDWFVERYLTREGETAEEAKARLKSQQSI